jgi:hypothetical protein
MGYFKGGLISGDRVMDQKQKLKKKPAELERKIKVECDLVDSVKQHFSQDHRRPYNVDLRLSNCRFNI